MIARFKMVFVALVLLSGSVLLMSDALSTHLIHWSEHSRLTWHDFYDTSLVHSDRAALTSAGIRISYAQKTATEVAVTVYSGMDPTKSWVDRDKKCDYILKHEQYHFNITEYWCRRLKKDIAAAHLTTGNLKDRMAAVRKQDFAQLMEMQNNYDRETKHSQIHSEQHRWEKYVDGLMASVADYSPETFMVRLR